MTVPQILRPPKLVPVFWARGSLSSAKMNQTVLISEQLLGAKALLLTANTTTVYNRLHHDTQDGPLVLEIPPEVLSPIDNVWLSSVADVAA